MDNIDKKILHILARNADATSTDIGEKVGLSIPAVNKRIAKMKKEGLPLKVSQLKQRGTVLENKKISKKTWQVLKVFVYYIWN